MLVKRIMDMCQNFSEFITIYDRDDPQGGDMEYAILHAIKQVSVCAEREPMRRAS